MKNDSLPIFSIITPVYNAAATLCDAIESVLSQDFYDYELILVNDGSNDDSLQIIQSYLAKDSRIKFFSLPGNMGVAAARNEGVKRARGRFISFLDSDDMWLSNKLSIQYKCFSAGASVVYGSYYRLNVDGIQRLVQVPLAVSYSELLRGNCIPNLTGAYDSLKLGKFYQKKVGHEDYLMWLNILSVARCAIGVSTPLAKYRVMPGSLSSNKIRAVFWTWNIYFFELDLGVFKSSFLLGAYLISAIRKRV